MSAFGLKVKKVLIRVKRNFFYSARESKNEEFYNDFKTVEKNLKS